MKARRKGRFLVIEGLDGAGTTTQARLLAERWRREGRVVHVTAEPSAGPVGALIRQVLRGRVVGTGEADGGGFDPRALALLFAADRMDHWKCEIAPALETGADVLSDRYTLSSLAYQSLTTGDAAWVEGINAAAPSPDLTIFLRVKPAVAVGRRLAESNRPDLYEVPAFQRKVASAYERCLDLLRERGERVEILDGERSVEEVAAAVARAARGRSRG